MMTWALVFLVLAAVVLTTPSSRFHPGGLGERNLRRGGLWRFGSAPSEGSASSALQAAGNARARLSGILSLAADEATTVAGMAEFVRELAAMLASGHTVNGVWAELERAHSAGHGRSSEAAASQQAAPSRVSKTRASGATKSQRPKAGTKRGSKRSSAAQRMRVAQSLRQQSADLALIRRAATAAALGRDPLLELQSRISMTLTSGPSALPGWTRCWDQLLTTLSVCQLSGAPVAPVLQHLAAALEQDVDAIGARDTALAGPRTTVRLLSALPFLAVGLALLLGINVFAVITGSAAGAASMILGVGFWLAARIWTARLLQRARRWMS